MTLKQQLQTLIEDAPQYGIAPVVIAKAIAPVLQSIAQQLQYEEYFLLQNIQEDWLISILKSNQTPNEEKKVIYAFATVQDAQNFVSKNQVDLMAIPLGTIFILFRIFSLQQIDSIIFLDEINQQNEGIELKRQDLAKAIEQQLIQLKNQKNPPDLA